MKSFSINRMWQVMKADLLMNKKALLSFLGGLTLGYSIWMHIQYIMAESPIFGENTGPVSLTVFTLTVVFAGVTIFGNMKTKQQRVAFLMLPASRLEKFASRALMALFGSAVLAIVALVGADVLRYVFHLISGRGDDGSVLISAIDFFTNIEMRSQYKLAMNLAFITMFIWAHSVYVLGASVFSRRKWLFTTATMFVVSMLFAWIFANFMNYMIKNIDWEVYQVNQAAVNLWFFLTFVALICLNYWASFKLFCRMQVINNKWLNV